MLNPLPARHPLALSLALSAALLLSLVAAGAASQILQLHLPTPVPLAFVPIAVILAAWATRGHQWRSLGYRTPVTGGSALAVTLSTSALVLAVAGASIRAWHWDTLAAWLAFSALVAFVEETFFRGVVLRLLLGCGWWRAWLLSSAIFGLGHAANLLSGTQTLTATLLQIGVAFAWGLFTAASYLSTLSLWPALVLHALFDCLELAGLHASSTRADTAVLAVLLAGAGVLGSRHPRTTLATAAAPLVNTPPAATAIVGSRSRAPQAGEPPNLVVAASSGGRVSAPSRSRSFLVTRTTSTRPSSLPAGAGPGEVNAREP